MAQALLNNLNKIKNEALSLKGNAFSVDVTDFGKIFNAKVSKSNNNKTFSNPNKPISENRADKDELNNNKTFANEFKNTVEESIAETVVDTGITENADSSMNTEDNSSEEDIQQEEANTQQDETNAQTNITEEEPTMLEDLTKLNESALAIIFHSKQISPVANSCDDEVTDAENNENQDIKNAKEYVLDTKSTIKNFENIASKDVQTNILTSKENPNVKKDSSSINKVIDEKIIKELNIEIVNSENNSNGSSSENLMQNQTPQEHSIKAIIQADVKFEDTISTIKTIEVKPTEVSSAKIIEQISKQLENMYNNSKLNIVLNPDKLGKVNLQILNGKNGLTAQFTVTTQDARDLLMKGLDGLKENLLAHGINIDNVSVKLEEKTENDTNEDWTEQEGSRGGNKQQEAGKQKEKEKTFEEIIGIDLEKSNSDS